ncbi:hypothetical protein IAR55_000348 [Kwoniella newhampshirensis]|uniref:tRNA adenylyltransferase n=1 Tax=Kwoniella newhampshirensis TaxID=1651941 RepID=A0AAW0Z6I3_9TREE
MSPSIPLSNVESTFVTLLDDFARRLDPPVECRIAGGWVRDKTKDIPTGSVGKVAANPEQSKHLETGTTRILGLDCDFVGLRSETYADSRIPQIIGISTKVSKERIGIEVTKMLHPDPLRAMSLIDSLGLHPSIFHCEVDPPRQEAFASAQILSHVSKIFVSDDALWLATAATPFRDVRVQRKGKDTPAVSALSTEAKDSVTNLFEATRLINPEATQRSDIGTCLQHPAVRPWERSMTWAVVMEILPSWNGEWGHVADAVVEKYQAFRDRIITLGLPHAIDQPLLLNVSVRSEMFPDDVQGTEIQNLLSIKPSPLLHTIRQAINVWQLDHAEGTKEECQAWLLAQWTGESRTEWERVSRPMKSVKGEKVKGEKRKR